MVPILVTLSSAHEILYRNYFLPTLPAGFEVRVRDLGRNASDGSYMSEEWQNAMLGKISHALDFCRESPEDSLFIVSDVDVQFFPPFGEDQFRRDFSALHCEMAFQKERLREGDREANCGFYAARNTPAVRALLQKALENLQADSVRNEQSAVNDLLGRDLVRWNFLPPRYYGRTHGFPPPRDIVLHHASWTFNIPQKIRQLDRVRRIVRGGAWRATVETYFEHVERARSQNAGWSSLLYAHRQFLSRLPIQPHRIP
jgi:hypothetical protein